MLERLFPGFKSKKTAYALYGKLVGQARQPVFYTGLEVTDTLDGRFDMILLHMFLIQNRLATEGEATARLRRQIQEAMVADMDRSLREMGVGDMGIGREVKKMGVAWFGRLKAYAAAVEADDPQAELATAIARNLYKKEAVSRAPDMAAYILDARKKLAAYSVEEIKTLSFEFPQPVPSAPTPMPATQEGADNE
ncbi:ubiquinol-cytochrome C chaperone family protein [Kordiimonas aestuarii]|uniref:ubiquinol-cytochrome C chaperone family protein n=1 Tax=Kordiimonas aestuarii TaxID=1005925 RepID=UPI0021CF8541|nr:ubiquinol-cytochrome C chaperone family protein [Kordiimonas aestuarii]